MQMDREITHAIECINEAITFVDPNVCKRSINPIWSKMGSAFRNAVEVCSSTAARFHNLQPKSPVAAVLMRGAATHRALGSWLLAVDLGGLDQAVQLRARCWALGCVAKQPVLAPDYERSDRTLGRLVVDGQKSGFGIAHQLLPVAVWSVVVKNG